MQYLFYDELFKLRELLYELQIDDYAITYLKQQTNEIYIGFLIMADAEKFAKVCRDRSLDFEMVPEKDFLKLFENVHNANFEGKEKVMGWFASRAHFNK
jgi:hypothetical protein